MFFLITINNFFTRKNEFKNYCCINKRLSTNKFFEFEILKSLQTLFEIEVDLRVTGRDHAGVFVSLYFLSYGIGVRVYDHRHWDHENNTWET
jgi:hypothetical protein